MPARRMEWLGAGNFCVTRLANSCKAGPTLGFTGVAGSTEIGSGLAAAFTPAENAFKLDSTATPLRVIAASNCLRLNGKVPEPASAPNKVALITLRFSSAKREK